MKNYKLINGECLEEMRKMVADGVKVDAIICDPPFGTMKRGADYKMTGIGGAMFKRKPLTGKGAQFLADNYRTTHEDRALYMRKGVVVEGGVHHWDTKIDTAEVFRLAHLLLKPKGKLLLFALAKFAYELYSHKTPLKFNSEMYWLKTTFAFGLGANKACVGFIEKILMWTKNGKGYATFNLRGKTYQSNVFHIARDNNGFHPTQKPVALMREFVEIFTNKGETVLDFTMGSGSTGIACLLSGRKFIGIEMDKNFFKLTTERFENIRDADDII